MDDPRKPRLLDQVRERCRVKHYSIRTEKTYADWIRRFILFHGKRHPRDMGAPEVEGFLSHLAVDGNVAASTQNQALAAICSCTARCSGWNCRGLRTSHARRSRHASPWYSPRAR